VAPFLFKTLVDVFFQCCSVNAQATRRSDMRITTKSIETAALAAGYENITIERCGSDITIDNLTKVRHFLNTKLSDKTLTEWLVEIEKVHGPVRMVERTNLMTGKPFMEAHNAPRC